MSSACLLVGLCAAFKGCGRPCVFCFLVRIGSGRKISVRETRNNEKNPSGEGLLNYFGVRRWCMTACSSSR